MSLVTKIERKQYIATLIARLRHTQPASCISCAKEEAEEAVQMSWSGEEEEEVGHNRACLCLQLRHALLLLLQL